MFIHTNHSSRHWKRGMIFCHIETVREAVRICVEDLKRCDIAKFEIKLRISRVTPDKFWPIRIMFVFFLTFGGS